jgi:hypothetical protein
MRAHVCSCVRACTYTCFFSFSFVHLCMHGQEVTSRSDTARTRDSIMSRLKAWARLHDFPKTNTSTRFDRRIGPVPRVSLIALCCLFSVFPFHVTYTFQCILCDVRMCIHVSCTFKSGSAWLRHALSRNRHGACTCTCTYTCIYIHTNLYIHMHV